MEESEFDTLKASLSNVPVKVLNKECRKILSQNLDIKQVLSSKFGYPRDFRGLAELMGFEHVDSRKFERCNDPTMKILEAWETHQNATIGNLIDYLEKIQRLDVIKELKPLLDEQAEIFQQFQMDSEISVPVSGASSCPVRPQNTEMSTQNALLTCEDLRTGECTLYDAYVCYADEDSHFVQELANFLESSEIGLKLFIRGRDMLAGSSELDTNIELIKNRCRQMLIILTENFVHSSQCAFQISFATSLSIEQRERILVPVLISPCDIPSVLLYVSRIDFTKSNIYEWMWERLILSLLPQKRQSVPSGIKLPAQPYRSPSPVTSRKSPVITFPETVKLSSLPLERTATGFASIVDPVTSFSSVSMNNPCERELLEPESGLNNSTSAKVIMTDKHPIITAQETVQELAKPIIESSAATKSSKASSKPPQVVSEKTPITKKIRNAFRSYLRKEPSGSNSSSYLSNVTSGYHSESTF